MAKTTRKKSSRKAPARKTATTKGSARATKASKGGTAKGAPAKKESSSKGAAKGARKRASARAGGAPTGADSPVNPKAGFSKGGRPPFVPTDEQREQVSILVGLGLKQEEIVLLVKNPTTGEPITDKTLRKHFARELEAGYLETNARVGASLFKAATTVGVPGQVQAAVWWSKCRMGWREKVSIEVEAKSGVLVAPPMLTPQEWIAAAQERAAEAKPHDDKEEDE